MRQRPVWYVFSWGRRSQHRPRSCAATRISSSVVGSGVSSGSLYPDAATIDWQQRQGQQFARQWYSNVSNSHRSNRSTSSLASSAFQPTNDDNGHEINYDYNHDREKELISTSFSMDHHRRPRLQALREQLRNEKNNLNTTLTTTTPPNTALNETRPVVHQHRHKAAASIAPTKRNIPIQHPSLPSLLSPSSVLPSLDDWNVFLSQLPDPPSWDAVLSDRFQRSHNYVRLSLTERCNFRCTYCMPPEGVTNLAPKSHLLQSHEIVQLAQLLAQAGGGRGVTKFRLTGGEPTLRKDLVDIVAGLHAIELPTISSTFSSPPRHAQIGMTTNGLTLSKVLPDLVQAGLSSVNISLDTLQPDQFAQITRRPASYFDAVWQSLQDACALSQQLRESEQDGRRHLSVKLNCVVMRGFNDHEVTDFLHLAKDVFPNALLQVRFIEYMPFTKNGWNTERFVSYQELLSRIAASSSNLQLAALPPQDPHDTTKWYTFADQSSSLELQHQPSIGFITSMSNDFCAGCNRLRLSADGQIKVCLFQSHDDDNNNKHRINVLNLRDALRAGVNEQGLLKLVWNALQTKHARLGGHENAQDIQKDADHNRPMTVIGG